MKDTQSLPRNTLYSALSAASNVMLVVLVIFAGRILGDTDYGKFSLALAIASIFEMPIDFGLGTLIIRDVARDRGLSSKLLHSVIPWKLVLSVGVMLLLIPTAQILGKSWDTRMAIYAMGFAIVLRSFKATTHSFFQAFERFDLVLLTTYTERVLVILVCGLMLLKTRSLLPFTLAFALARIPDLIFSYWLLNRSITKLGWRADARIIKAIQKDALPFGSLNIVTVLYAYLGTVILGAFRGPTEVGWYAAGYRIYEGLTMFPFVLSAVLLPRLSNLYVNNRSRHTELSVKSLKYGLILSVPILICGWLLAPRILTTIFGAEYIQGTQALRMLVAASLFMFSNRLLNVILISTDRQTAVLRASAIGLAISACANLILVRLYGATGAGISALIAEVCVFLMFMQIAYGRIFAIQDLTADS